MRTLLCTTLLVILASPLRGQVDGDIVLMDTVVVAGQDVLPAVQLSRGNIYRIVVSGSAATPSLQPTEAGIPVPDLIELNGGGATGLYEIALYRDGTYRVTLTGGSGVRTRVRLYADSLETDRKHDRARTPKIGVGLAFDVGYHGGYGIGSTPDSPEAGALVDACLLFSDGRRFSLCLGAGRHFRTRESLLLFFVEPRVSVLRWNRPNGNVMDLGLVARMAQGSAASISIDPSFYAGGVFFSYGMSRDARGHGTGLTVSAMYGPVRNVAVEHQSIVQAMAGFWWVP